MEINKENAIRLWEAIYGEEELVKDCFGTLIYKNDYDDLQTIRNYNGKTSNFGWNIDHILPISRGGTDNNNNLEPMHIKNNIIKEHKSSFKIHNIEYEIYKCRVTIDGYEGYGIKRKDNDKRVDWKYRLSKHF